MNVACRNLCRPCILRKAASTFQDSAFFLRRLCSSTPLSMAVQPCIYLRSGILTRLVRSMYHMTHSTQTLSTREIYADNSGSDDISPDYSLTNRNVVKKINEAVEGGNLGRLFAVVQIASKQRKITTEDIIIVEGAFMVDIGDRIKLEKILMVGSKDFSLIGRPMLNSELVRVEATVIEKTLSHSKTRLIYRPRKRNQRFTVQQNFYTMLQISSIELTQYDRSKSSVTYQTGHKHMTNEQY